MFFPYGCVSVHVYVCVCNMYMYVYIYTYMITHTYTHSGLFDGVIVELIGGRDGAAARV